MRSRRRCSMCPAIHINSRSWLRSSSTHEPSDPPPRVLIKVSKTSRGRLRIVSRSSLRTDMRPGPTKGTGRPATRGGQDCGSYQPTGSASRETRHEATTSPNETTQGGRAHPAGDREATVREPGPPFRRSATYESCVLHIGNDPSAGSPTETLLRLLLPLDDQVRSSSRHTGTAVTRHARTNPRISLNHPIGSSDGRCVQRAGT